jgi:hypothetical protein
MPVILPTERQIQLSAPADGSILPLTIGAVIDMRVSAPRQAENLRLRLRLSAANTWMRASLEQRHRGREE